LTNDTTLPLASECFLNRIDGLWKYEFGEPYVLKNSFVVGHDMCPSVRDLLAVVHCANKRLSAEKRNYYFERLSNPGKHMDTLVEFSPILRLSEKVTVDFEVATGVGNRNVDWLIRSNSLKRLVLVDVKRRIQDILELLNRINRGGTEQPPTHDASILFRSIEEKYASKNPDAQLQGAWIMTDVQQEESEIENAFNSLDESKVHFAILGDWDPGIKLLTRRDEDRQFLFDLFRENSSNRMTFSRPHPS